MALMALSAPVVWADSGVADKGPSHQACGLHHDKDQMFAKVLGLSDDQVKQLKDIHQKQKDARKTAFEQMKSDKEAIDVEIIKATPDMARINDWQAKIKTIQAQMADDHLNSVMAIKKLLTPEQFAGYMALKKAKRMMMHGHHGFGDKGGFGKEGYEHKHWGDKADKDDESDADDQK